jgi:hypothetical protein
MKMLVAFCVCSLIFATDIASVRADESRFADSGQEIEETLPEVGDVLLISFPNLSGDDLLTMEFVVTREMLDSAWSLNDVFVAAKLEARSGNLPVKRWNKPLEAPEKVSDNEVPADDDSDCD